MINQSFSKFYLFVLLGLICLFSSQAQVRGVLIDSITRKPIAFASIVYEGETKGVMSNESGQFTIPYLSASTSIKVTTIGYQTKTIPYSKTNRMSLRVLLMPQDVELKEVVVKPKRQKYSRKNNPAVDLINKVIAKKNVHKLESNDFYQYDKYQKYVISLNDVDEEKQQKGIFKRFPFLVDHVDVSEITGKQTLPISINETVSEKIYRKKPSTTKEFIKGTKRDGIEHLLATGDGLEAMVSDIFTEIDLYDNNILFLQNQFVSPIASYAPTFYQFYIADTLSIRGQDCIHLSFLPQNPQDFGFIGDLYVTNDSNYVVKQCTMRLPRSSGVNFVKSLYLHQEFEQQPSGEWTLGLDDMAVEMVIVKQADGLLVRRVSKYTNYSFEPLADSRFAAKEQTIKEDDHQEKEEAFWTAARQIPLTQKESEIKQMIEQVKMIPGFQLFLTVAKAFIENFIETGNPSKFDFGPVNTSFTSNFIDGTRLRLSGQTTAFFHPQFFLSGYGAYGFRDNRFKYRGTAEYSLTKKEFLPREFPRHSVSITAGYDVFAPTDKFLKTDKDNVFVSFKRTKVDQMSYIKELSTKYEQEFYNGFSWSTSIKNLQDEPAGSLSYIRTDDGSLETNMVTTELGLFLRFAPGEKYVNTKQRRMTVSYNVPIFTASHIVGISGILGGEYRHNLTQIGYYRRFWLNSYGFMDLFLNASKQWNKVPFPLLIMPPANQSYILQRESFNLINNMEFLNDQYASLDFTYNLNGKLFNRIPLLKKLKWREVIRFKTMYGTLSDKNNPNKSNGLFLFPQRDGETTTFLMEKNKPYMEASVGIYNILKIVHIEYVRRLNYLNLPNADKHGIRLAMMLVF